MRTAMKATTYCAMHFVVAIGVAYALTRNLHAALAIGLVEPFVQTFCFTLHDRAWARAEARRQRDGHGHGHGLINAAG